MRPYGTFYTECCSCGASVGFAFVDIEDAIEAWNKRSGEASIDSISRQAAIEAVNLKLDEIDHVPKWVFDELDSSLEKVPAAEPKKGKWVIDNGLYRCSACNHLWSELWWVETVPLEKMLELMPYCPKCGAKMENAAGVPDSSIGSC